MIRKLQQVWLVNAIGIDRTALSMSSPMSAGEFHLEADYHQGRISDVNIYRDTNHGKTGEPNWEWYAGVPTANIKSYTLAGDRPPPVALDKPDAEPEAPPQAKAVASSQARTA